MPDALIASYADAWERATRHPFLVGVREGTLSPAAFATWLAQDALFVEDLLAFQARLLARAPRAAQAVLAAGALALVEEQEWFEELAAGGGTELGQERLPATQAYADLLTRLDEAPYPVAVTALWVIERVYLLAWRHAAPGAPGYRSCVQHWTAPSFAAYVDALGRLADDVGAPGDAVAEVLALETAFWDATGQGT